MGTEKQRQGFRDWLSKKGIGALSDAEVDHFIKSTRIQWYFWGTVILLVLIATGVVVWHDLKAN